VDFDSKKIIKKTDEALKLPDFEDENIYYKPNSADSIIKTLKQYA